jgi:D-alanine-D-alanine ligase
MRVAVLMGGMSAEREVSLETGRAIAGALRELGHEVVEIDVDRKLPERITQAAPDAAFMAIHGRGGEDGTVQGMLEIMRVPYTGCGVLASAMTIDKVVTKEILSYHDVPLVEDVVLGRDYRPDEVFLVEDRLGYPVMVKPSNEGSSIGVIKVDRESDLEPALGEVFTRDETALIERFVEGRLLTVGILGAERIVLPVLEITPREGFYDYEAKYQPGMTEYEVPAPLEPHVAQEVQRLALESFDSLRCEGVARIDLMLEEVSGKLYVLEVNTIPGMTATSLLPKAALAMGMEFTDVVDTLLRCARLKLDLPG